MSGLNGFFLLDKAAGVSSHRALSPIKALLPRRYKVGHTGTLDPNATGLLPVALGRATRFIEFLKENKKLYSAEMQFGLKTDSADIWGNVIDDCQEGIFFSDSARAKDAFEFAAQSFVGEYLQVPPMYSAIKKDGKPLYKLAREGIEVERKSRKVTVYWIEVKRFDLPYAQIEVSCSSGTYIRTLIEDIAKTAGTIATMTALNRIESDGFLQKDAKKISEVSSLADLEQQLISLDAAFKNLPALSIGDFEERALRNGIKAKGLLEDGISELKKAYSLIEGSIFRLDYKGEMFALCTLENSGFSIKRV